MLVEWSRKALSKLDDAVEYIASDNPGAAAKTARRIWECARELAGQPGLGRPGRVAGTRELVIPGLPFVLPYVEKPGVIIILRVIHTSMKWPERH